MRSEDGGVSQVVAFASRDLEKGRLFTGPRMRSEDYSGDALRSSLLLWGVAVASEDLEKALSFSGALRARMPSRCHPEDALRGCPPRIVAALGSLSKAPAFDDLREVSCFSAACAPAGTCRLQ